MIFEEQTDSAIRAKAVRQSQIETETKMTRALEAPR